MVRGFVQQQDVRPPEQQLSQLDAHAPSAAELRRGPVEVVARKPEAEQRPL